MQARACASFIFLPLRLQALYYRLDRPATELGYRVQDTVHSKLTQVKSYRCPLFGINIIYASSYIALH